MSSFYIVSSVGSTSAPLHLWLADQEKWEGLSDSIEREKSIEGSPGGDINSSEHSSPKRQAAEGSGSRKARVAKLRDFWAAGNDLIKSFLSGTLH